MKNKKTTQEKNIKELMSLLSKSKDASLVFEALFDEKQLEVRVEYFAEALSLLASLLSVYKLRTGGHLNGLSIHEMSGEDSQISEVTSTKYCLKKLLKEFERFDESVSEVIEAKEQLKLIALEKEKLTSNSSEEEVSTPFH